MSLADDTDLAPQRPLDSQRDPAAMGFDAPSQASLVAPIAKWRQLDEALHDQLAGAQRRVALVTRALGPESPTRVAAEVRVDVLHEVIGLVADLSDQESPAGGGFESGPAGGGLGLGSDGLGRGEPAGSLMGLDDGAQPDEGRRWSGGDGSPMAWAPEMPGPGRDVGLGGGYGAGFGDRPVDPHRREIAERNEALTQRSEQLAGACREAPDGPERQRMLAALREVLERHFELRTDLRRQEAQAMERRLAEVARQLDNRSARRGEIIERRLDELLARQGVLAW